MKTSIEFINHASVIIKGKNISLLSDPWFQGDAFNKGWNLLCETTYDETVNIINKITHIWISHEHPDHFSVGYFKKFAKLINEKKIKILFQDTKDKRIIKFIESLSIEYIELNCNINIKLDENFSVMCIKDGFYDSALLVTNEGEKILNLNDCDINIRDKDKVNDIYNLTGNVDVLLTQFSYAAWKGGFANKNWRTQAAIEKLDAVDFQISIFRPKILIPFASFIYFSNKENFYLNDSINTPAELLNRLKYCNTKIFIMQPKDIIGGDQQKYSNELALKFWNKHFLSISEKKINIYQSVDYFKIRENFLNYCKRIENRNSLIFISIIRFISPISVFSPVIIYITDLNFTINIDYVSKKIDKTNEVPMINLHSESLNFLFNNTFGYDTLTVNGCFEEGRADGFVTATKSLAIESLNNLGIFVTPRIIYNFSVIKLFFKRLYRIAKKINT